MTTISRRKGARIAYGGEEMKVVGTPDFATVTLQNSAGEFFHASLSDLEKERSGSTKQGFAVDPIRESKTQAYADAFRPLLDIDQRSVAAVDEAAKRLGISRPSAYRALARYDVSGNVSVLPPPTKPGGRGKSRLDEKAEKIVQECIEEVVLSREFHSRRKFLREARRRLEKAGLTVAGSTLIQRLANIPDYKLQRARKGFAETRRTHEPLKGHHPEVAGPLACIQIDHWKSDVMLLSDDRLHQIGRAWITIAIDLYSRMVWGFHVALSEPSTTAMAMAMINGMTRKDAALERYALKMEMPIAGKPQEVRADNAGEFTGKSIKASCQHFNIKLTWRPIDSPQYGGHIERLNGTLATKFRDLPGATGASTKDRKHLRPEKTAAFTLEDLTKHVWLLIDEYHNEIHTGIKTRPIDRFKDFYYGPQGLKRNLPEIYPDTTEFRLGWYPMLMRTVQQYGIRINYLDYYNEEITQLVLNRKKGPKVAIRLNPFDVREIYIEHPTRREWVALPARHVGFPIAALWELQAAIRIAHKDKRVRKTPENLARIIDDQHAHVEEAKKKTKTAQRAAARRAQDGRIRKQIEGESDEPSRTTDNEITILTKLPPAQPTSASVAPVVPDVDPVASVPDGPASATPASPRKSRTTAKYDQQHAFGKDSELGDILAQITDEDIDRHFHDRG